MSPRFKILRKVLSPPTIKGFKPYGKTENISQNQTVTLHFEEYEALRLCDYDGYTHHQSSVIMRVSRPTFTRIYASCRQKIAKAFVEGSQIAIEGGKVYFDSEWYYCRTCKCNFNNPHKEKEIKNCPLCSGSDIDNYDDDDNINTSDSRCLDLCICPKCGAEHARKKGDPCRDILCPDCNSQMLRKRGKKH